MPYSFTLTTIIPASAQEIYDAWLDSLAHSEMTGGPATMSDEVGAEVSAWGGYITGRNLELVPGARIVQSWRTSEFADEHEDSIVAVTLEEVDDGTLVTLEHSNVPDEQRSYEEGGWQSNYFEPMAVYFAADDEETTEAPETPVAKAPARAPRRQASAAPKKPAAKKTVKKAVKKAAKKAVKKTVKKAAEKAAKKAPKKAAKKSAKKASKTARKSAAKSKWTAAAKRPKKAARSKRK